MAKISVDSYKVSFSDIFFFDTNIWLLLFGTVADFEKNEQRKYSNFFAELVSKDKPIYTTSLVFSEFSNVLLRRDFRLWQKKDNNFNKDFKRDFVGTAEYKKSVESIKIQLNKILTLPNLVRVGDSFHILNFDRIFTNFDFIDFNDSYYAEVCLQNNYKLVSNDRDLFMLEESLDIITALS
ncbi:PIN domain-containing protein [Kaistella haifensis DSM 19056]|uniref:PIN domain-containing protein n=1 Tax=Kaistella haifensis DSM 19056 TaxID=1450526 RepID=A0A2D0A6B6_9FLAO|nr:PIN domain-containing protein [Kaistella haifensis]OWK98069.1 PIN domain-containing protein [Kaistella haifensis DSM 19056]